MNFLRENQGSVYYFFNYGSDASHLVWKRQMTELQGVLAAPKAKTTSFDGEMKGVLLHAVKQIHK